MIHLTYHAIPCDEPPPMSLVREAMKRADNTGEPVRISDAQGRVYKTYYPEV